MRYFSLVIFLFLFSCGSFFQAEKLTYSNVKVQSPKITDSTVYNILAPYQSKITNQMNEVIATLTQSVNKAQPNGNMGLLFVDAMRIQAEKIYNRKVDAAFINNGGLRIPSIPAGNVTVGKIYEVMPFDNLLVVQKVRGSILYQLIEHIGKRGGWPVSGVTFTISNGVATNILVNGQPIDWNNYYTIANSDYIANGGDDCIMLKQIPQETNGVFLRDVFIDYFRTKKTITPINERRVGVVE